MYPPRAQQNQFLETVKRGLLLGPSCCFLTGTLGFFSFVAATMSKTSRRRAGIGILLCFGLAAAILWLIALLLPISHPTVHTVTDTCDPCSGDDPSIVVIVDHLVAGGGTSGLATADNLALAYIAMGVDPENMSIAVVEKREVFGGNVRRINVTMPDGYTQHRFCLHFFRVPLW